MPLYEFRCEKCKKKVTLLFGMSAQETSPVCPTCQSPLGSKLVSRPGKFRTEDDRIDDVADRLDGIDENDVSGMTEMIREVGKALDEDVSDDLEQMLDAEWSAESSESDNSTDA